MLIFLAAFLPTLFSIFRSRAALELENLALRHQIGVLQRSVRKRPRLTPLDRLLWVWLFAIWSDWRSALAIVQPETVIAWHRKSFRFFWTWKVRLGKTGRPTVAREVRHLIRRMCRENPRWGAPRIYGGDFHREVTDMGIQEVLSTPRSPWQRAYIERVIGSIRRECLDHVIVFDESSLRRILRSYLDYYHRSRTHLSLGKDSPEPRSIQPEQMGRVVALPQVGGLHHRYERRTA